ncbi:uncharacterized protein A4U43_C03F7820 [Asparagus officinalis]|uniref:Pentatricopeptide repeat-containing protein n=1 Tax=Asparagus officinalis TaxID=4686 RepID=A0A5P1FDG3_ASPOF|nr:pentatricopeptide repeat-containing protein At5g39680-like [Asparagus officinalis]XP_020256384.1 pentatricopeptide repeat-containing protein At5g39680-like [Asparagus officinalis]XP_020256385.1 pentatricopeptide repeat-containing protein At5g39680-like [Asparagus officinalis]XP_020256386.1 pentatricopeptide repeat-containing protein At5g39680-like [Asparagus officinalis]ONK74570.1 uncharacterized protein A4U43_C03F7820 [Asparagus officinalis]
MFKCRRCYGVHKTLPDFDIFSFNSMLNTFLEHGYLDAAAEIMRSVMNEVDKWDQITYVVVLGLSANLKDLRLSCQLHSQILRRGLENGIFNGSTLVDMYGKCNDVSSALYAFSRIPNRNVVSWKALIAICTQHGCFEEALKLFLKMVLDGVQPNDLTFSVTLHSCVGLSTLINGDALNALAQISGHKEYLHVGNALINMYSKCGSIEEAYNIFNDALKEDNVSWSSIITGYSHHSLGKEALGAFHSMLNEGVDPTCVTFVSVLSACGHLGLVREGYNYLDSMSKWGIYPGLEHYTWIIISLRRAGLLDEAKKYVRCTHIEWDIITWQSPLNGCVAHRIGLGKQNARHILQFDPNDVETYILLSNIYARESLWYGAV